MTVTTSSLKFYINGHENWLRNMAQLSESVKQELQEKEKNISQWMTSIHPKQPNKGRPIGYSVSVNHIKKDWKVSDIYTFVKTNFSVMRQPTRHCVTVNVTYYCFP